MRLNSSNIILFLVSFIFSIMLSEIILNLTYPVYSKINPNLLNMSQSNYENTILFSYVNRSLTYGNITRNTNSYGFGDREFTKKVPDNTKRILVLGDSFTFGIGNRDNETYPYYLQELLNSQKSKEAYEIYNLGLPGMNTLAEAKIIEKMLGEIEADIVIIGFFPNDFEINIVQPKEKCMSNYFQNLRTYNRLKVGWAIISSKYNKADYDPYFINQFFDNDVGWNCFQEGIDMIKTIVQTNGGELLFVLIPDTDKNPNYEKNYKKIINIVEKRGIETLNLYPYFKNLRREDIENTLGHFTPYANLKISEQISKKINQD